MAKRCSSEIQINTIQIKQVQHAKAREEHQCEIHLLDMQAQQATSALKQACVVQALQMHPVYI
jgi:hypothetical protein